MILLLITALPCYGYEADIEEYIPDLMTDILPEDMIEGQANEGYSLNFESLPELLLSFVKDSLKGVAEILFIILSLVVLCALFSLFCDSIVSDGVKRIFSYLSSVCFALVLYSVLCGIWDDMSLLFDRIHALMKAITPSVTLLYALGGNISTASVTNAGMSIMLSVFEDICRYGIRPILQICFGFSLVSCLSGSLKLEPMARFVEKIYTTVLIFVISIMTTVMSMRSFLAVSSDTMTVRTVRFASSAAVPIVGGALSEASAGVASGIGVLKSTFGILCVIALCLMVLPTIINIWMSKAALVFGGAICSVFGVEKEMQIITSASQILNFALAITFSVSLMFIINLCIFAGATIAIGG